jgi:hypothetical protein
MSTVRKGLEAVGKISRCEEHFQLQITIVDPEIKPRRRQIYYVYIREIDQAVKCFPYYAKVFKIKDPVETCFKTENLEKLEKVKENLGKSKETYGYLGNLEG